jgi:hypothetical protein
MREVHVSLQLFRDSSKVILEYIKNLKRKVRTDLDG